MKRIIIRYEIAKRNFWRRVYQRVADMVIVKLEKTTDQTDFDYWYAMGCQIDIWAKNRNIYLK
jgi:mannose/cellobiose epimerase-like protein (N-acyl-D-glucosamine 2-epimerase family)